MHLTTDYASFTPTFITTIQPTDISKALIPDALLRAYPQHVLNEYHPALASVAYALVDHQWVHSGQKAN
jgi:hypothetical protein